MNDSAKTTYLFCRTLQKDKSRMLTEEKFYIGIVATKSVCIMDRVIDDGSCWFVAHWSGNENGLDTTPSLPTDRKRL